MSQDPSIVSWKRATGGFGLIVLALLMLAGACVSTVPDVVKAILVAQAPALILGGLAYLGVKQHQDAQAARLATVEAKVDDTHQAIKVDHAATLDVQDAIASVAQAAGVPAPVEVKTP